MFKRRRDEQGSGEDAPAVTPAPTARPPLPAARPPSPQPDSGVGVPPFRPATPPQAQKEASPMARPPFNTATPPSNQPPPGAGGPARPATPGASPATPQPPLQQQPHPQSPGLAPSNQQRPQPQERRTLVVGRGISLQGVIQDAERLVVEGTVEAQLLNASELSVAAGGTFKGEVEVEDSEVAGTMDGAVTARGSLVIRSTGRVIGTARCRRLQVEDGGQISGRIEMITEPATPRGAA
jgi:cytoskeletal protein CcmA (bactofilin family)